MSSNEPSTPDPLGPYDSPLSSSPSPARSGGPATAPAAAPSPEAQRLAGLETLLQQFGSEMLRQRRSERRWRIGFRLAWFGLVLAVAWAVFTQHGVHPAAPSGPHTALIEVRGEIAEQSEASAENIVASLKSAYEDDSAKGIVMRFNSPGGSPVQAGIVSDEIQRLRKLHPNKKLYAVCEEMCASAAYYMAANADEIYVDKASIVGSIGVLMDGFGFTGLMDKLGVERRLLTAGANKGMLDPFSPVDEKQKAYAEAMLEQIHQQFITVVKRGRGDRLKLRRHLLGPVLERRGGREPGLADHYGNLDYVAREVVKAEDVIDYTPQENVAERLAKRFGASIGEGVVHAMRAIGPLR
jgi:protease-4